MVDASLKAEAQALRKKGLAWAKIALHLGINERTVYKWRERGEVSDGGPPASVPEGPTMSPAEIVESLWSSLSRSARALAAAENPGAASTTRTLREVSAVVDKLVALRASIDADAARALAEECSLDEFRIDIARRLEGLRADAENAPEGAAETGQVET